MKPEVETPISEAASDNTEEKQSNLTPFKKGQSGNPAGRPRGSRNKVVEASIAALSEDFEQDPAGYWREFRQKDLSGYMKLVASLWPKKIEATMNTTILMEYEAARDFAAAWKVVQRARSMIGAPPLPEENSSRLIELEPERRDAECSDD